MAIHGNIVRAIPTQLIIIIGPEIVRICNDDDYDEEPLRD